MTNERFTISKKGIIVFILISFSYFKTQAGFVDLNMLYLSDSFKTSNTTTSSKTSYDLGFGLLFGSNNRWMGGLNVGGGTFADDGTISTSYSFSDMGIKFGYFLSSRKTWLITLAYNISSTATYDDGTSTYKLRGTSLKADLGYSVWISDQVAVALKIFYYLPTITESVQSSTLSEVSYNRSLIYPGLSLIGTF